ncbi:alkyl/aryl-sulfatase [Actinophytocola sp.]|uniref:alkyl/aryl-sulfatase n=1 Tax=Actinophytocola sp. TaxID=1872138 RepID=UPI003D6A8204
MVSEIPEKVRPRDASPYTAGVNAAASAVPGDARDVRAGRGLVAPLPQHPIDGPLGRPVWDPRWFAFIAGERPDSVHPGLWRVARRNVQGGLFQLADGVFQVRGLDLAAATFVHGTRGWIVVDPLSAAETARAAHDLVREHVADLPVTGVVYTRPHLDHFGGGPGVVDPAEVRSGRVPVVAPEGFGAAVAAESLLAGPAMGLRAASMFGLMVPPGPLGRLDCGLGLQMAPGSAALVGPTVEVPERGAETTVDGVRFVFRVVPPTEARAEMNFFLPDHGVLCFAESCLTALHNVYAPRADPLAWSKELGTALRLFGDHAEVAFGSHGWPHWGGEAVRAFLRHQRDAYRYLHDQTLRLAARGLGPDEIAAELELPDELRETFSAYGRQGRIAHSVRAVYHGYLGWYALDPGTLEPVRRAEAATRDLAYMGGADAVLERAHADFERGDYRWVADVLGRLLRAEPENTEAALLRADALEQLAYQSESAAWRNCYLTEVVRLRGGLPDGPPPGPPDVFAGIGIEDVVDAIGVSLDPARVRGDLTVSWRLRDDDPGEYVLGVANRAVYLEPGRLDPDGDATVTTTRRGFGALAADPSALNRLVEAGELEVTGRVEAVRELFALLGG